MQYLAHARHFCLPALYPPQPKIQQKITDYSNYQQIYQIHVCVILGP
jgi:hypothetical protein